MIEIETIPPNILRITPPETLRAHDFQPIAPQVEEEVRRHGKIRLLVDARRFHGWEDIHAFETHMGFVKTHMQSVERAALIAGAGWQHWLAGVFRLFVHPEVHVFDAQEEKEALHWLTH
jgi:hypothetical protein